MSDDIILDEGAAFFGEVAFDRVHLENRIKELEENLAQSGRIHEGLMKDKDEAFEERFAENKEQLALAEGRCKRYRESYDRVLTTSIDERNKSAKKLHTLREAHDDMLNELCLKDEQGKELREAILEYEQNVNNHIRSTVVQAMVAEKRSLVNRAGMEFLFKFLLKHSGYLSQFVSKDEVDILRKVNSNFFAPPPLPIWHDPVMEPFAFLQKEWEDIVGKALPWEALANEGGEIAGVVMPDVNVGEYLAWSSSDDSAFHIGEVIGPGITTTMTLAPPTKLEDIFDKVLLDD